MGRASESAAHAWNTLVEPGCTRPREGSRVRPCPPLTREGVTARRRADHCSGYRARRRPNSRLRLGKICEDDVVGLISAMREQDLSGSTAPGPSWCFWSPPQQRRPGAGRSRSNPDTRLERGGRPSIEQREMRVLNTKEIDSGSTAAITRTVEPSSTRTVWPVTRTEASPARKIAAPTGSRGRISSLRSIWPARPPVRCWCRSLPCLCIDGVRSGR